MSEKFKEAIDLINDRDKETYPTFAYSILDNFISGKIYMDDSGRTALIGTDSGVFVLTGDSENNGFNSSVIEIYKSRKKENKRFTLFSPSKEWDEAISKWFEGEMRQINRYSFHFNINEFSKLIRSELPIKFKVRTIDRHTISKSQGFKKSYFNEYWGSTTNYLEKGFGYCLLVNDSVASECASIFASLKFAEMDIVTQPNYKRMGLAQRVAEKFIEHCIEKNVKPRWDCNVNNFSSIKLAEKLGFENPIEYSVFVKK